MHRKQIHSTEQRDWMQRGSKLYTVEPSDDQRSLQTHGFDRGRRG